MVDQMPTKPLIEFSEMLVQYVEAAPHLTYHSSALGKIQPEAVRQNPGEYPPQMVLPDAIHIVTLVAYDKTMTAPIEQSGSCPEARARAAQIHGEFLESANAPIETSDIRVGSRWYPSEDTHQKIGYDIFKFKVDALEGFKPDSGIVQLAVVDFYQLGEEGLEAKTDHFFDLPTLEAFFGTNFQPRWA